MRWKLMPVFVAALLIVVAGCGNGSSDSKDSKYSKYSKAAKSSDSGDEDGSGDEGGESGMAGLEIKLDEQESSGITGKAEFTEKDGKTKVEVYLTGSDEKESYASHVHPGTCDDLDPTPKYPLDSVTGGRAETTIGATIADLEGDAYAVNIHDDADPTKYVACGNIAS